MDRKAYAGTPQFWTQILDLEGFEVVSHRYEPEENVWRFTVIPDRCAGVCPDCGAVSQSIHQKRDRDGIHDLPMGEARVELRVRQFQFTCEFCEKCFTPECPFLAEGARATERFLECCARLIRTGDVANAAAFFGLPEKTLERWYYAWVERRQRQAEEPETPIRSVGIDELSLKKNTMTTWR